jgi:PKD repeat protein
MKKMILLLVAIVLNVGTAFPQCYYYNTHDFIKKYDAGTSLIQTNNNGFISVGSSDPPNSFGEVTYTLRIDKCGGQSQKFYSTLSANNGGEQPNIVFENSETSSFIHFGQQYDHSEGTGSCFIFSVSANGDSTYHKVINHGVGLSDLCKSALKLNENAYILGGYYNEAPPDAQAFLSKVDSLGNIIWQRNYGDTVSALRGPPNIIRSPDGGYLIGIQHNYYHPVTNDYNNDIVLIKTDSTGNELWQKSYRGINNENAAWGYVINTRDGGYAIFGVIETSTNSRDSYVIKTDSIGNIQWRGYYDYKGLNERDYFTDAVQLDDGSFIVGGHGRDTVGGTPRVRLTKLSKTGDLLWDRLYSYYGGQTHDYLEDFIITRQGDIAVTGYIIPSGVTQDTTGNDMFILKVDSCGYLKNDSINADFSFTKDSTGTVSFTNQSSEFCTSYWRFGNGDSSKAANPQHSYADTGVYTVELIVRAGNSLDTVQEHVQIQEIKEEDTVGGRSYNDQKQIVKAYPNPAGNIFYIQSTSQQHKIKRIEILGLSGRQLITATASPVSTSSLPQGIYFYQVRLSDGKVARGKFVRR